MLIELAQVSAPLLPLLRLLFADAFGSFSRLLSASSFRLITLTQKEFIASHPSGLTSMLFTNDKSSPIIFEDTALPDLAGHSFRVCCAVSLFSGQW